MLSPLANLDRTMQEVKALIQELDSSIESKRSKMVAVNAGSASTLPILEPSLAKLKWFITLDEIDPYIHKDGKMDSSLDGIIHPEEWVKYWSNYDPSAVQSSEVEPSALDDSDLFHSEVGLNRTNAYINYRNKKLSAHSNQAGRHDPSEKPRYLLTQKEGGVLPGLAPAITSVHSSAAATILPSTDILPSDEQDGMVCSDGSCFVKRKNIIPSPEILITGSVPIQAQNVGISLPPSTLHKVLTPPKKIMKLVGQAIKDFSMIQEGDRLLLGLSGGKDSLTLLHTLIALQVISVCFGTYIERAYICASLSFV